MSQWDEGEVVESGGIGVAVPPLQGMRVSPAQQAQADKARLAILEQEVKANPNDPALGREVTAERKKQGAAAPLSAWDESEITPIVAPADNGVAGDLARGFTAPIARTNSTLEQFTPLGQGARFLKRALGIDKTADEINAAASVTPDSTAGRVGNFVGDVALSAPAALALPARIIPQVVGNAALSAGLSPENPGEAALWGAGGGAVGHALGRTLGAMRRGAQPTPSNIEMQDWINKAQAHAGQSPTPILTPGQLAPKDGWLRRAEETLANVPLVGAPLRERAKDAMKGFQQVSRDTVQLEGNTGAQTIEQLKDAFTKAYSNVLKDVKVPTGTSVRGVPDSKSALAFHEAERELKSRAARMMNSTDLATANQGRRLIKEAGEWRNNLPDTAHALLGDIDAAYARFAPIKKASEKAASALVSPEEYTPKDLLRVLRGRKGEGAAFQRARALKAEDIIGSTHKATPGGGIGLGTVTLASLLTGTSPLAAAGAGAGILYGTKTGQKVARSLQRTLTADETAAALSALRRGPTPALAGGKKDE